MQKIPQKIVVLFAIVKISYIFFAYFFVNFCLKIWKNYTRWKKKLQNFTVIFIIANLFEKFCPFFCEKFCTVQKNHVFYAKYCRKIFNAKITAKVCEKIYEKINGKHFNLIPPSSSSSSSSLLGTSTTSQGEFGVTQLIQKSDLSLASTSADQIYKTFSLMPIMLMTIVLLQYILMKYMNIWLLY